MSVENILVIFGQLRALDRKESDLRILILESELRIVKWEAASEVGSHEARYHDKQPSNRAGQIIRERTKQSDLKTKLDEVRREITKLEKQLTELTGEPEPDSWLPLARSASANGSIQSVPSSHGTSRSMHHRAPGQDSPGPSRPIGSRTSWSDDEQFGLGVDAGLEGQPLSSGYLYRDSQDS